MSAESLLELTKLALSAPSFEEAVRPTLVYLVGGVPAMGAVLLEQVVSAGSESPLVDDHTRGIG